MERAVDGDNVALCQHLLEILDTSASNLLLHLRLEGLVVKVQQLLAVEWFETSENALTNTTDGNGSDDLALKVELVLGHSGNVPVSSLDLLVGGDEVADESEDGHDDVLGDGDDVATSHLGDGDTAVGSVGSVQVDVVGTDTCSHGNLQLLCLGQTLGSEVSRVETGGQASAAVSLDMCLWAILRSGDDDFGINQFLVKLGVLSLLV